MSEAGAPGKVAWRAGGAVLLLGLGCLAWASARLRGGLPIADGLAILIALSGWAGLVAGIALQLARRVPSRIPAMAAVAAALVAELWSGVHLPGAGMGVGAGSGASVGSHAEPHAAEPARAPDLADIRFTAHPDVYLIGFLGASPGTVLQRSLGLSGSALEDAFAIGGFRAFPGVFSEAIPTRNAWDLLLGMTRESVAAIPDRARGAQFSGNHESPLFDLFRRSGYQITTLTEDFKFGSVKGDGIDRYVVHQPYSICKDRDVAPPPIRPFVFFGACLLRRSPLFPEPRRADAPPAERLIEVIRADGPSGGPRLTVAHLKPPLHAPSQARLRSSPAALERFARRYEAASQQAAEHLLRILEAIRANERDFVLFVFGDQGVGVLHKLAGAAEGEEDRAARIRDRFAVLAAVYPEDACAVQLGDGLQTTAALLRGIVTCLAGGRDPWPAGYAHRILVDGVPMDPRELTD